MTWYCHCGIKNNGLNVQCAAKSQKQYEHYQVSENKPDFLMSVITAREFNMTPQEELFAKFYNQEKILVKDMDLAQMREHRDELAKIAFEAKARLVATDDETRERQAKKKNKEWLVTADGSQNASDAINVVEARKKRMSKMDKMRMQLLTAGIDEATVKEMIANMEHRATNDTIQAITFKSAKTEEEIVPIKFKKPEDNGKPFDPSTLSFGDE